jgi:hypothetical protein
VKAGCAMPRLLARDKVKYAALKTAAPAVIVPEIGRDVFWLTATNMRAKRCILIASSSDRGVLSWRSAHRQSKPQPRRGALNSIRRLFEASARRFRVGVRSSVFNDI